MNEKSPCILRTFLFGTPGGNRTHNGPLGGGCYIHLTTEAYKVLMYQRFLPRRVSAAFRRRNPSAELWTEVHMRVRSRRRRNSDCYRRSIAFPQRHEMSVKPFKAFYALRWTCLSKPFQTTQNKDLILQRKYNTIYRKKNQSIFCPFCQICFNLFTNIRTAVGKVKFTLAQGHFVCYNQIG